VGYAARAAARIRNAVTSRVEASLFHAFRGVYRHHGPRGIFARTWATGEAIMWVAVLLAACLIFYYL
jgi:multicomponent Na+:H+ antiporter subunit D